MSSGPAAGADGSRWRRRGSSSSARRMPPRCRGGRGLRPAGSRPARGARPGPCATRARDRAGRWPRPAARRSARLRQDAPGPDHPGFAATARRRGRAHGDGRGLGCWRRSAPRAPAAATVPSTSPHDLVRRHGRRRAAPVTRRSDFGRSGSAVPRRASRVRPRRPRGTAPADGGGERRDRPCRTREQLPGPLPARGRDEPVSVRVRRLVGTAVRLPAGPSPSDISDGSQARCATGSTCGSRCRASRRPHSSPRTEPEASAAVATRIADARAVATARLGRRAERAPDGSGAARDLPPRR